VISQGGLDKFSHKPPLAILGAGSWGTALAVHLVGNSNSVRLWGRDGIQIETMRLERENKRYLPGVSLPEELSLYSDLSACLDGVQDVIVAVPSTQFESLLESLKPLVGPNWRLLWVTKGLDQRSHAFLSDRVAAIFSKELPMAVLSGPSFAKEVAQGAPTAVSLAGNSVTWCEELVERFHSESFRVYINEDFLGVQLCAVGKNVLAVAVGMADGLGLGANSRAALITRGLAELSRLLVAVGGSSSTLLGLAGVGDIILTCTDNQSRNRRFGLAVGSGLSVSQARSDLGLEVEGVNNVSQLYYMAKKYQVVMPVVEQVYEFFHERISLQELINNLVSRPACSEF
jgi:glycerol-3-phosphate dehydrogenase (NAD(P)+)